jgi:predicted nucleic acid-binding protein
MCQCRIYAYDACIIASAHNQKCPLATLDTGLVNIARQVGITVLEVGT